MSYIDVNNQYINENNVGNLKDITLDQYYNNANHENYKNSYNYIKK
jgi:hypothetical protein